MTESFADGLDDTTVDLDETSPSADGQTVTAGGKPVIRGADREEANLILISHPENRHLGKRFRLTWGTLINIGRSKTCELSFPEVLSLSRRHGRMQYGDDGVSFEDQGSTNGSFLNDRRVLGRVNLSSGDRLQFGALHFKFLHGGDVEHAYYEAIYHLMTQDGLTGIHNRRTFDEELQREFARAKRHQRPLSLILFDIDDFKLVNDRCGHLCGDFVLKGVVDLVRKLLRTEQVFSRVGGDEFAVLCPETSLHGSSVLAEKIRARIADHEFDPDLLDRPVRATCSFGNAELSPTMGTPEDFYAAADRALYRSKNEGRNRVTVYSSSNLS